MSDAAMTKSDIAGAQARAIPSQTAHSLATPDGLGAVPILVSWSIRNGAYQIAKVRWGVAVSKEEAKGGA